LDDTLDIVNNTYLLAELRQMKRFDSGAVGGESFEQIWEKYVHSYKGITQIR
jgi:hypothetical protein